MIKRKEYLQKLIDFRGQHLIKVVTGVRRCGKSTLFQLYIDYLKSTGILDKQIIFINLEDLEHEALLNHKALYTYIQKRLSKDTQNYVFIDEVQQCHDFEKVIDSLFIKTNIDVHITGSNAYMLSGELATLLSGRYITIDMLPLSFQEYTSAITMENSKSKTTEELFSEYMRFGSFPYIVQTEQKEELIRPYLEGIYNTILIKDVAKREGITDISLLENIARTLASSIGSPISTKKISDTINSSGRKISVNTVDNYVRALTDSYIFYKVDRFDIKGRQYLKTLGKYYLVDTGIRSLLLPSQSQDLGHVIENIVYLELLRRGYQVNIGKLAEKEVDFVARKMDEIVYFQVSASVLDEKTLERELAPLMHIPDHFPKVLLTLDIIGSDTTHNGIRQLHLLHWLLDK